MLRSRVALRVVDLGAGVRLERQRPPVAPELVPTGALGPPGPHRRRVALAYCELARREVEYVSLSRDTTGNELCQRRELVGAAGAGEGVSVVPTLNHPTESCEMPLRKVALFHELHHILFSGSDEQPHRCTPPPRP